MTDSRILDIVIQARDGASSVFRNLGNQTKNAGDEAQVSESKFSNLWKQVGIGTLAANAASRAMGVVEGTIGDAIKRVDTLNNSSKVFSNLGFRAGDVKTSMKLLDSSIKGLPTSLNEAVSGMQSLALQNGNILASRKEFTAMNDAVLSSGHSTADLDNAIQQITQLDMKGPLDSQTWDSLRQSGLEPAMKAMADMSSVSMAQLKTEFGNGTLKVQDFMSKLEKLDNSGTGHMASLSKQAKDMTGGIGTGMANAQTAITRGIANIIQAIGSKNISSAISALGTTLEKLSKEIVAVIKWTEQHKAAIKEWVGVIAPAAGAILLVIGALKAWKLATDAVKAAQIALTAVMDMNPIILAITAVIIVAALVVTHWKTVKKWFSEFWSNLKQWFSDGINFIKQHWELLVGIMLGPIALIAAEIIKHWNGIKNGFSAVWNGIVDFFKSLPGKILGFVSGFGSLLFNAGKDLIGGLVNGIKSMVGAAGDAAKGVGNEAVKGIKNMLGIHSPSTVFADIGQNVGLGLIQGITGTQNDAKAASGKLAQQTIAGAQGVSVPRSNVAGSTVANANQTAGNGAAGVNITINYNGRGQFSYADGVAMARQIILAMRSQGLSTTNFNNAANLR